MSTDQAIALCEQALHEARRAADEEQERMARLSLAQCLTNRGDIDAARRHLAPALPAGSEQTSHVDAICLMTQAVWLDYTAADFDAATTRLEQVLTGPYSTANWIGTAARGTFGLIMLERGDHERARSWFAAALELAETNSEELSLIWSHLCLVPVECAAGHLDEADAHFRIAAQLRKDTNPFLDLRFLKTRANLALHSNSPGDAVTLAAAALALADGFRTALDRCECLRLLGDAELAIGDLDQARPTFEQLIAYAGAIPAPCRLAEGHEGAAAAAYALGNSHHADEHLAAATEIRQRTGSRRLPRPPVDPYLTKLESQQPTHTHDGVDPG